MMSTIYKANVHVSMQCSGFDCVSFIRIDIQSFLRFTSQYISKDVHQVFFIYDLMTAEQYVGDICFQSKHFKELINFYRCEIRNMGMWNVVQKKQCLFIYTTPHLYHLKSLAPTRCL